MLPSFNDFPSDDPLSFIREFYSVVQTFPLHGITKDDLCMSFFPFCHKDRAKSWLLNLPEGFLRTWEDVYNIFMSKYCSPQKTLDLRNKICTFAQMEEDAIHEAWERFKLFLAQCPHQQYPLAFQVQFFIMA